MLSLVACHQGCMRHSAVIQSCSAHQQHDLLDQDTLQLLQLPVLVLAIVCLTLVRCTASIACCDHSPGVSSSIVVHMVTMVEKKFLGRLEGQIWPWKKGAASCKVDAFFALYKKPEGRKVCNTSQEIAAGIVTQCTTLRSASTCKNAAGLTTVFHTTLSIP